MAVRLVTYQLIDRYRLYRANGTLALEWEVQSGRYKRTTYPADAVIKSCVTMCRTSGSDPSEFTISADGTESDNITSTQLIPNPTNGMFSINYKAPANEDFTVTVFNTQGVSVMEATNQSVFDESHLPQGIYMVKITAGTETVTRKLQKD